MVTAMPPRDWAAPEYHQLSAPHQAWGREVLDRLELRGDETVLDAGCGTGRITQQLLDRWLEPKRAYLLAHDGEVGANPDQRVQEDTGIWSISRPSSRWACCNPHCS